jgi:glutamine amidotransferase
VFCERNAAGHRVRRVLVLDYGSGNLHSARRALQRCGADVEVGAEREAALAADGLVVPGVGAFAACMAGLDAVGAGSIIADRVAAGRPVLGICVGMQVLFAAGVEHGVQTAGLGLLAGRVERLNAPILPHTGWNTLGPAAGSVLFAGMPAGTRFYFVHSYAAHAAPGMVTYAEHGERFVAALEYGPLSATQFHPEQSGDAGSALMDNWLGTL